MKFIKNNIYAISAILLLLIILGIIISYFFYFSGRTIAYRPLYFNLTIKELSSITNKLNKWGYDYKTNGTDILAKKDKINEIKINISRENIKIKSKTKNYNLFRDNKSMTFALYYMVSSGIGIILLLIIIGFIILIAILIKVHYSNKKTQVLLEIVAKKIDTITKSLLDKGK